MRQLLSPLLRFLFYGSLFLLVEGAKFSIRALVYGSGFLLFALIAVPLTPLVGLVTRKTPSIYLH